MEGTSQEFDYGNSIYTLTHLLGSLLECPTLSLQTGEDYLSSIQQMPGRMRECQCVKERQ